MRVPPKTLELWRKAGIVPRGAMREIMELMHRSHMDVDQDCNNIVKQCSRTALAAEWGGSSSVRGQLGSGSPIKRQRSR